jgi:hypothetical protein
VTSRLQLGLFRPSDTCVIHKGLVFALILLTTEKKTQIFAGFQFFRFHKEGGYDISAAGRCKARTHLERSKSGVASSYPTRYTRGLVCSVAMGRRLPSTALQVVNEVSKA